MNTKFILNGQILVDVQSGELKSRNLDQVIRLEPLLLNLLLLFVQQPRQVVSRERIIEALWEGNERVGNPALTKAISKLRQLFIQYFNTPDLIDTLPKKGYRFTADVKYEENVLKSLQENRLAGIHQRTIGQMAIGTLILFLLLIALKFLLGTSFHYVLHGFMH